MFPVAVLLAITSLDSASSLSGGGLIWMSRLAQDEKTLLFPARGTSADRWRNFFKVSQNRKCIRSDSVVKQNGIKKYKMNYLGLNLLKMPSAKVRQWTYTNSDQCPSKGWQEFRPIEEGHVVDCLLKKYTIHLEWPMVLDVRLKVLNDVCWWQSPWSFHLLDHYDLSW